MFKNDIFLLIFHQDPPLSSFGLQKTDPFLYHLIIISSNLIHDPKTHVHSFVYPIGGALASVILLFTSEYLLLYRFFPSSFKGDVGDNLITQFLSFLYFSITTIATANLGDILPDNLTARALIATEIAFNLFTIAIGIQLLLAQKS